MTTNTERSYLNSRLMETQYIFRDNLGTQFRINNSEQPQTYSALIDAIKNGQYTLDTKRTAKIDALVAAGERYYVGPFDGIKFTLPDAPDWTGYRAAIKAMEKAFQSARDIVQTADATVGLKALQDFEAWTFIPTTTTA